MVRICCICGEKTGFRAVMIKNQEYLCYNCVKAAGHNPMTWLGNMKTSKEDIIREIHDDGVQIPAAHTPAMNVTHSVGNIFKVDKDNRLWYAQDMFSLHKTPIHKFEEVLDFELLEDGNVVTKGGTGRAFMGGIAFGAVGAMVGATTGKRTSTANCTSMRIKITLNDLSYPVEYIDLLKMKVAKKSAAYQNAYKQAQEILSMLQIMTHDPKEGGAHE